MFGVPQNKKVVDYKCVSLGEVMPYINKGWLLYGSPFFHHSAGVAFQVMIKVESFSYDSDEE